MSSPFDHASSLCWKCRKSSSGLGCNWVDSEPSGISEIPGWKCDIIPVKSNVSTSSYRDYAYIVKECPLFEPEGTSS